MATALLEKREEAVAKLEDLLSQASGIVLAMERKVLDLNRQKQKDILEINKVQQQLQDTERKTQGEAKQMQVRNCLPCR